MNNVNPNSNSQYPTQSGSRLRTVGVAIAGAAVVLAACGGSNEAAPAPAPQPAPNTAGSSPVATPAATIGSTGLGEVLVAEQGRTLYGFTNDVDAKSTCYGTCADAWPPVIVGADWVVAPGLDAGIFAATVRDDGQLQLVAGKWPLYYFAGDAAAGDTNGQNSGDVWFAAAVDGSLVKGAEAPADSDAADSDAADSDEGASAGEVLVTSADIDLGTILVDAEGLTLYGFTADADGNPTCNDACADAWPPFIVEGDAIPDGLDPTVFSVVSRDDGTSQLKAGKWPLYYFAGDATAGDTNGQGSGDVWFAAAPDGGLVKSAQGAATPDETNSDEAESDESDSGYGY